ncbi:AEC family transporter [Oceanobacter mangrovi]|uniref:AEC family transporter n=1 Tax=Oceanobacter mangrovi TaxID=2862510 RepID=UPI001C8EE2B3|nr:AEC family transporter [Oceanobacter mangrovi]
MFAILSVITPIFAIIGLGYFLARRDFLPQPMLPLLSKLVLFCLIPALTFKTVAQLDFSKVLAWDFLGVYAVGALLAQLVALLVFKGALKQPLSDAAVKAMGVSLPNSIFIGYPIVVQAFGEEWGHTFAFAVMVENIVILPSILIMAELGKRRAEATSSRLIHLLGGISKRVATNPVIIAITCGVLVSLSGLELPAVAVRTLTVLGNAAGGIALLVIGGSLVGNPIRGNIRDVSLVSVTKLLIHPLMVVLVLMVWPPFNPTLQDIVIVYAALPMAAIFPIIGSNYGLGKFCASSLVATTISSFVTLTIVLTLVLG